MKNNFLLSSLLVAMLSVNAHAISYDFNLGFGGGFDSGITASQKGGNMGSGSLKELTWSTGGFVGGGFSFPSTFTSSIGLEYTGKYVSESQKGKTQDYNSITSQKDAFDNFLDVYYKVGLMEAIPMDLQINVGLAARFLVKQTITSDNEVIAEYLKQSSPDSSSHPFGLGVHVGMRYNVHMFFLGVDYSYIPLYKSPANTFKVNGVSINSPGGWGSGRDAGLSGHSLSVSLGLIFNKSILDSFLQ